ncbi:MAG: sigma-70 family RNA polymerase sigma factor [Anaerolineales bacterium]|nr:sigma-70 family RNA polymerase sigma factor [Anaerolineales bacterium]MCB9126323.1 sigma-70 family RNA polymerase sigma factor [Ardenticatenales bacterium]MCB9171293.1 sigma-70 family RNA polymerase sigma factor [Ardenticatenales bacterium]
MSEQPDILERTKQVTGSLEEMDTDNLVAMYLREGAQHDLLDKEEELELATMWRAAMKAEEELASITDEDERQKVMYMIRRGETARQRLIRSNLRLVVSVAARYQGYGVPLNDLIQEGNMGLMHALTKFEPERGFKFSTYATWWIRHAVGRAVANQGRTIRLPVHMAEKARKVKEAAYRISQRTGNEATTFQIAEELEMTPEKVEEILQLSRRPLSFDNPVSQEDDSATLGDFLADEESITPYEAALDSGLSDELTSALSTLSPREARILGLRYGLRDGREHTLKEIGEKYGLTRERIRQIEKEALRKLRHPSRSRKLRSFVG